MGVVWDKDITREQGRALFVNGMRESMKMKSVMTCAMRNIRYHDLRRSTTTSLSFLNNTLYKKVLQVCSREWEYSLEENCTDMVLNTSADFNHFGVKLGLRTFGSVLLNTFLSIVLQTKEREIEGKEKPKNK